MVGIVSIGVHIPVYRLKRDDMASAWGIRSLGGERAVAGHDEDSLTMAVNAALDCVRQRNEQVDGLFFATTTSPYKEKQAAATIATALDLSSESCTADMTGSRRSATTAINLAMSMVESCLAQNVLVTAADCRLAAPQTELEQRVGDAAAAVIIGNSNPIARIVGSHSVFDEFFDSWRLEGDIFVRSWEERFTTTEGYMRVVKQAISQLLKKHALSAKDFSKVVLYGPDPRSQARLARSLGFDTNTQLQDLLFTTIGDSGTAAPLLMLTAALEKAKVGDKILLASYGDGSDLFILEVTENIGEIQDEQRMQKLLARKIYINYEKYLSWRNLVTVEFPRRPELQVPSVTCRWRERRRILALYGVRCRQCGTIQYPPQRVCLTCGAKDNFEDYKFSDKKARIFTYATDRLTPSKAAPTVNTVIEFEGGGRMICELTDCDPTKVELGMPVEMTFRKLHEFTGMYDYFWKARPVEV
jgi:3-hydroxy-3-methylglutaryl CoA synthase